MLRTLDIVLVLIMTATAVVTYTIKHRADEKLAQVHKLDSEIKLEKDTIDLLRADWALLTQPNRLDHLIGVYGSELALQPTQPTQLAMPKELPMLRSQLPQPSTTIEDIIAGNNPEVAAALKGVAAAKAKPASKIPVPVARNGGIDPKTTGSVKH
jgi:hypothetical protein